MNRSIFSVILGGFGTESGVIAAGAAAERAVKAGSAEDAAFIMKNASSISIVPDYGMAVAQAQHALREMSDILKGGGRQGALPHPPGSGPHARAHERAVGRGQCPL
jgi:NAD(P) transhydrogenase subunit beta